MLKKTMMTILVIAGGSAALVWAQPPDMAVFPGDERARPDRWQGDRLEKMAEYLELSDAQIAEWQAITGQHSQTIRARWGQIGTLREEFAELADSHDPNLEQLGQIALDLHQEMKKARAARGELVTSLEETLTVEQAERFAALQAARELAGNRAHRGPRGHRQRTDLD
jgi:Spy/CpxP family protein refolding chaperone